MLERLNFYFRKHSGSLHILELKKLPALIHDNLHCDVLCFLRGQECAGIVTSNGASPPTYTAHKVTLNHDQKLLI